MLDATTVEGFVTSLLQRKFDSATSIPACHKEWWELVCSDSKQVAIAAPRNHAKSTSITFSWLLAAVLFRQYRYVMLVSDTESQAVLFLGDIKQELLENEDLIELFGVSKFIKYSETDIIVQMEDGHQFRIIAKGSEQQVRGRKWNNLRPDLIVCHEKDTDVYTPETGWIKNQDYPGAKLIHTDEAYEVEFEDGTKEVVSGHHRYYVEGLGWTYPWQMKKDDNVIEKVSDDTLNEILKDEKNLVENMTIVQKVKLSVKRGLQIILISTLLLNGSTTKRIKNRFALKLNSLLKTILLGKLLPVQNKKICGLHTIRNLQVIPSSANYRKGNKFES